MSKRMITTFFPATTQVMLDGLPFFEQTFPESVADQCPEVVVFNSIRQPALLMAAILGVAVGFLGFQRKSSHWALGFAAFGIMNLSAIPLHCLLPAVQDTYPSEYPFLWALDTYMTGFSAMALCLAAWKELPNYFVPHVWRKVSWMQHLVGVSCTVWFFLDPLPEYLAASYPLELWYLATPALAGLPVVLLLFESMIRESIEMSRLSTRSWDVPHTLFLLGVICIGIVGIAMDRIWCEVFQSYNWSVDLFTASTMVFLGCDFLFVSLLLFNVTITDKRK